MATFLMSRDNFISLPRDHYIATFIVSLACIIMVPMVFKSTPKFLRKFTTAIVYTLAMILLTAVLFTMNGLNAVDDNGNMKFTIGYFVLIGVGITLFMTYNAASRVTERFQLSPEEEADIKKWNNQPALVDHFTSSCGLSNNCQEYLKNKTEQMYNNMSNENYVQQPNIEPFTCGGGAEMLGYQGAPFGNP